jgi:ppGpp synthetase/RelA/SpoT-type nucleotidyltranferase
MSEKKVDSGEMSAWLDGQVGRYSALAPSYRRYAEVLEQVLGRAAREIAPQAIVQTRAKKVPSFAEKALRKRHKYSSPVDEFTDLCGGRVIARTRSEVNAFCELIEREFDIDWENSLDASQRLRPAEFGYRSIHYIVLLRDDRDYGLPIPEEVYGLKAEIQVRTMVEHAFADFGHDLSYKGAFEPPVSWQRELASVAAALEEADQAFSRIEERLRTYAESYGAYLDEEELRGEIENLEIVLAHDPQNVRLAARLAKLAIIVEDWDNAIAVLSPHVKKPEETTYQPVLRDLGVALCKKHRKNPDSEAYGRGQNYLELASAPEHADVDAISSLAGSWKGIDESKVREYYRQAFEVDSTSPYALGNYLECELQHGTSILAWTRPLIRQAIERCRAHIEVGFNLPWAFYDLGKFQLLLGEPYESLDAYANAVQLSSAAFMIETSLGSLDRLKTVGSGLAGYEWVRRLLMLSRAARYRTQQALDPLSALATADVDPIRSPVLIVAGGTDPRVQEQVERYSDLLMEALEGFEGTIISGGTTEGVSGLVGDVAEAYGDGLRTIGYLPKLIPADAHVDTNARRYSELRKTEGHGFTPLEPLQNWIDIFASGIEPVDVRVIGINGGRIAAAEFRIALALGATVGLIAESGREAGRLLTDVRWAASDKLVSLEPDARTARDFVRRRTGDAAPE